MAKEIASEPESALRFLFTEGEGTLFRPTRCWIKPEGDRITDWSLHLKRPDGPAVEIQDLKRWFLFGNEPHRYFEYKSARIDRDVRQYKLDEVLHRYLRAVVAEVPAAQFNAPLWCLIPGIGDPDRRKRYRQALERALPGVKLLPEPEMLVEYFRLVRRELELKEGQSNIYLVVDAGASTVNLTFVLTRRDRLVTEAKMGVARKASLRAKRGDAGKWAGAWVDEELARMLGLKLPELAPAARGDVLDAIERVKCHLARDRTRDEAPLVVEHLPSVVTLQRRHLESAAERLWDNLLPTYLALAEHLLADLQSGADAETFQARLAAERVTDASGVQHLIDGVLLAGGTSQLPGFERAMMARIFPAEPGVNIHAVGADYSIAASVGALANVLAVHHRPSRLRADPKIERADSLADAEFIGTPVTDIFFAWKRPGEAEREVLALDRDDPIVESGGARELPDGEANAGLTFEAGASFEARLVPGPGYARKGIAPQPLAVRQAPGAMSVEWQPSLREANVRSEQVSGTAALHLALNHLLLEADEVPTRRPRRPKAGGQPLLWSDGAPDVVIDLGMSKTVVLTADAGPFERPRGAAPALGARLEAWPTLGEGPGTEPPRGHDPVDAPPAGPLAIVMPPQAPAVPLPGVAVAQPAVDVSPPSMPPIGIALPGEPASPSAPLGVLREVPAASLPALPRTTTPPPEAVMAPAEFGPRLLGVLQPLLDTGLAATASDLTMLVLALAVRPFVLMAGPPGSGKSTLVRMAARLLGLLEERTFHEITVQPHWRVERQVPQRARDAWQDDASQALRLFLFDEINLARPENYLMSFFRRLDQQGAGGPILACGTLNIDDASRPPSPKVIDRCLLLEIDAPKATTSAAALRSWYTGMNSPLSLPTLTEPTDAEPTLLALTLSAIRTCVEKHRLRQDLLPSHRDVDLRMLHAARGELAIPEQLMTETELLDRAMAGRLLVKLSGSADQVKPLVDTLEGHFGKHPELFRCNRRIALARQQLELGFVSPWH